MKHDHYKKGEENKKTRQAGRRLKKKGGNQRKFDRRPLGNKARKNRLQTRKEYPLTTMWKRLQKPQKKREGGEEKLPRRKRGKEVKKHFEQRWFRHGGDETGTALFFIRVNLVTATS